MDRTIVSVRDGWQTPSLLPLGGARSGTQNYLGLGLWGGMGRKRKKKKTPNDVKLLSSHSPQETTEFCICQLTFYPAFWTLVWKRGDQQGIGASQIVSSFKNMLKSLTPRLSKCKLIWE